MEQSNKVYTWRDMARLLAPGIRVVLLREVHRGFDQKIAAGTVLMVKENGLNEIWCCALFHMEHDLLDEVIVGGPHDEDGWDKVCDVFQIVRTIL